MTASATPSTPVTPVAQDSYSSGSALPAVGTPAYAAAQGLAARAAPPPRVNPDSIGTGNDGGTGAGTQDPTTVATRNSNNETIQKDNDADAISSLTQGTVNEINSQFSSALNNQKTLNASTDARAYALNSSRGLGDSGTGESALDTEEEAGFEKLAGIRDKQTSAVSAELGKIDTLRQSQINAETNLKGKDDTAYQTSVTANQKQATDSLTSLAQSGVSLSDLMTKEPQTYATLKSSLGLSDLEMSAKYNSLTQSPIDYTYITDKDGNTYGFGVDPKTGQLVQTPKQSVPGLQPGDTIEHTTKGGVVIKTATGAYKPLPTPAGPKPISAQPTTSQVDQAKDWLAKQPGFDMTKDYGALASDPAYLTWAIQQSETEKKSGGSSSAGTSTPSGADLFGGTSDSTPSTQ